MGGVIPPGVQVKMYYIVYERRQHTPVLKLSKFDKVPATTASAPEHHFNSHLDPAASASASAFGYHEDPHELRAEKPLYVAHLCERTAQSWSNTS